MTSPAAKNLNSAEQQLESARARYDQEALFIATRVEHLYWDLYAGERDYAVQKLTRDRAAAFLKDTELRAQAGLIGPNQVANARAFLAEQEILLLDREEQLDGLSDQLAAAIGVRRTALKRVSSLPISRAMYSSLRKLTRWCRRLSGETLSCVRRRQTLTPGVC